jgi:hypothetical protein
MKTRSSVSSWLALFFLLLAVGSTDVWFAEPYDPNSAAAKIFKEELNVPVVPGDAKTAELLSFSKVMVRMSGDQDSKRIRALTDVRLLQSLPTTNRYLIDLDVEWLRASAPLRTYSTIHDAQDSQLDLNELCKTPYEQTPDKIRVTMRGYRVRDSRN